MIGNILAAVLSGLCGALGLGGGGVLILYLTLIADMPQIKAQGVNLIFFIPAAIPAVILHAKHGLIDFRLAAKYLMFGIPGIAIGYLLINHVDKRAIIKIFPIILICTGIRELIVSSKKNG